MKAFKAKIEKVDNKVILTLFEQNYNELILKNLDAYASSYERNNVRITPHFGPSTERFRNKVQWGLNGKTVPYTLTMDCKDESEAWEIAHTTVELLTIINKSVSLDETPYVYYID